MPTSVINSLVVLIVGLICHYEKVYEEIIFCKTSQYKSQLHFPSQNNRTYTKLDSEQSLRMVTRARKSSEASESWGGGSLQFPSRPIRSLQSCRA